MAVVGVPASARRFDRKRVTKEEAGVSAEKVISMVFGATLLASLVLGRKRPRQRREERELDLTPSRDSEVSGKATLTDVEDGVKVELTSGPARSGGEAHQPHPRGWDLRR